MTQSTSQIAGVALIWRAGVVGASSSWFGFQFLAEFYAERPSDPIREGPRLQPRRDGRVQRMVC